MDDREYGIKCRTCGQPVTRDAVVKMGAEWVHVDDEVSARSASRYDHEAQPTYIDISDSEKKSESPLVSGGWPWYVAIRPTDKVPDQHTQHTHGE